MGSWEELTDVTEFKWYEDSVVHKLYLSAILDLYDRRIVSFVISEHNDNPLVFKTFDKAVKAIRMPVRCSIAIEAFICKQEFPPQTKKTGNDTKYVPCSPLH